MGLCSLVAKVSGCRSSYSTPFKGWSIMLAPDCVWRRHAEAVGVVIVSVRCRLGGRRRHGRSCCRWLRRRARRSPLRLPRRWRQEGHLLLGLWLRPLHLQMGKKECEMKTHTCHLGFGQQSNQPGPQYFPAGRQNSSSASLVTRTCTKETVQHTMSLALTS